MLRLSVVTITLLLGLATAQSARADTVVVKQTAPAPNYPFVLRLDASGIRIGMTVQQLQDILIKKYGRSGLSGSEDQVEV